MINTGYTWPPQVTDPTNGLERAAVKFHHENPDVFDVFERLALHAIALGKDVLSVAMIWEVMRWEMFLQTDEPVLNPDTGDPLKLNNNHKAYYARWFEAKHPRHADIFRKREVNRAAQQLGELSWLKKQSV